jgi:hypothetical protein
MELRSLPLSLVLLPLVPCAVGLAGAQEAVIPAAAVPQAARLIEPGPRWTGRYIVHVVRDERGHAQAMRHLGALRRAGDRDAISAFLADYSTNVNGLQAPVIDLALEHGAELVDVSWISNSFAIEHASPAALQALVASPAVRLVQADAFADVSSMTIATDAAHHNSDYANTLLTPGGAAVDGSGVTLAMIDTGIDANMAGTGRPHAAFFPGGNPASTTGGGIGGSRILSAVNSSYYYPTQPAEDFHGHGTRMASIAAGARFNALPGVDDAAAFDASIRTFKISDDAFGGLASIFSMDKAFGDILAYPDVIVANMSYDGTPSPLQSPNVAIESATLADVFVTLSAGNFGADLSFAHGSYNAMVVGASDRDTKEPAVIAGAFTSAIGPLSDGRRYPHVLAVGEALTCAVLDNEASSIDSYGCSGAAAFVAGSAVLVRQANPALSALEVKALLLNTSEAITLGKPAAAGWGYLRTDLAVEAALAGKVVEGTVATGELKVHPLSLAAGEEAVVTLAWNRESGGDVTIDDLDLRVRDPLGAVVGWSASLVDNVEQLRFTAPSAGVYKVQVIPIWFDGDGMAEYALAGVTTASIDPSVCTPGPPVVLDQSPAAIPAMVQGFDPAFYSSANFVVLTGCNFLGVSAVKVGGTTISAKAVDDNILTFHMPIPAALGAVPLQVTGPGGTFTGTIQIAPADNVLNVTGNILGGALNMWIGGHPGDFYAIAFSPSAQPTIVPGLFSVDIGDGGLSLFPLLFGNLNTQNGVQQHAFMGVPGSSGLYFYSQGITLDALNPTPPWTSTNAATTIYTH